MVAASFHDLSYQNFPSFPTECVHSACQSSGLIRCHSSTAGILGQLFKVRSASFLAHPSMPSTVIRLQVTSTLEHEKSWQAKLRQQRRCLAKCFASAPLIDWRSEGGDPYGRVRLVSRDPCEVGAVTWLAWLDAQLPGPNESMPPRQAAAICGSLGFPRSPWQRRWF